MAKNKAQKMSATTDYAQMQRNIQKAKGNPNKNVHQKKNGSDYRTPERDAAKAAESGEKKSKMPLWVKIALAVAFAVLLVMVILINTSLKGNPIAVNATSLITGVSCLLVYYSRRFLNRPPTTGYKILSFLLLAMGIVYTFMGLYGFYTILS